jgi:hypothetical protein
VPDILHSAKGLALGDESVSSSEFRLKGLQICTVLREAVGNAVVCLESTSLKDILINKEWLGRAAAQIFRHDQMQWKNPGLLNSM